MTLDRYFWRQEHLTAARTHRCPSCGVVAGQRCLDQYGIPGNFVHPARAEADGWYDDPYPLTETRQQRAARLEGQAR